MKKEYSPMANSSVATVTTVIVLALLGVQTAHILLTLELQTTTFVYVYMKLTNHYQSVPATGLFSNKYLSILLTFCPI